MRELLIGDDIANQIRMTRSQHKGAFIIVEGGTDSRLHQRFVNAEKCQFIPANGKEKTLGVLQILDEDKFVGALAIVDADFWRIEDEIVHSPNLFITDSHDIETMMLASPALDKILVEWGSENKIGNFVQQYEKDVRQILLDIGQPIGYLRLVSIRKNLSLKFEGIQFSKFIDRDAAQADHDPWDVCSGHDLICILSFSLVRTLGSNQDQDVKPELLEKILRVAYEYSYFVETKLYESLNHWEISNPSFPILRGET